MGYLNWDPSCAILVFERVVKQLAGLGAADPAQIAKGEQEFRRFADVLNGHLAGKR